MSIVGILLATVSFLLFGLASDGQVQGRTGRPLAAGWKPRLKWAGGIGIAVSFVPAIATAGWVFGPIAGAGAVMLGAGLAFIALNFAPGGYRRAKRR